MPLPVRLHWPSRNALLLLGSSHDRVPGTNVAYSDLAYSRAFSVSALLMTTLFLSSTSLPPKAHSNQCVHELPSPVACPRAKPPGVLFFLSACISFKNPSVSLGMEVNPAALT